MNGPVYTIGHSTHPLERFISLLKEWKISAVCDVRSTPYSRIAPQYNRDALKRELHSKEIVYVYLGRELGARSPDPSRYVDGKANYDRIARTDVFRAALDRVQEGMKRHRLALMCSEKDPLRCHRAILLARHLEALGVSVEHILEDGSSESHPQTIRRLLAELKLPEHDLFRTHDEVVEDAYLIQGERIAYEEGAEVPAPSTQVGGY